MESAPSAERVGKLRRRSSILKMPVPASPEEETEELTSRRASRRVSFANRFHVQEFCTDEVTVTRWAEAYEKETHVTDSSGEASAAALDAARTPLLDTTQHLNASMDLTDVDNSFVLAPVTLYPSLASGGSDSVFEAALGPLPTFLREDSDPDKENMAPRPSAAVSGAAGVGLKVPLGAAAAPGCLTPAGCVVSPPRSSASGGGLLELLGGTNVATPEFLRQPAPGGVLDLLRRAGVVSQASPPSAPPPTTPTTSGRSVLELLGDAGKVDTPPFLRYLDALEDDIQSQGRMVPLGVPPQDGDTGRESADMEITTPAVSRRTAAAASGAVVLEMSQMELTGSSTQTVGGCSGRAGADDSVAAVLSEVDDALDKGLPVIGGRAVSSNWAVTAAVTDMELTGVLPRGLPPRAASTANRTAVDGADMELTAAVPQTMTRTLNRLNQTIADGGDMEFTAAVPQIIPKSSNRLNKSVLVDGDMELTAAVPQSLLPDRLSNTVVEGADMELTAAVPQIVQVVSSKLDKSIVEGTDMELTAAVPQTVQVVSSKLDKSIVEGADMELTAAVPQTVQVVSSKLDKSIVEGADMELTAAVPQTVQVVSSKIDKSIVKSADMTLTAVVPQMEPKSSGCQLNRSTVDGGDMELTAAVPQVVQQPASRRGKDVAEDGGMALPAAGPAVLSTTLSKTVLDDADMELTTAVAQVVQKSTGQLNKSTVDGADMELTAAVPQLTAKPSGRLSTESREYDADLKRTVVVPQTVVPEHPNGANSTTGNAVDIVTTASRETARSSSSHGLNMTVADEEDMEVTAAIAQLPAKSSRLNRTLVDVADMEETAAVPQSLALKILGTASKSAAEGGDIELTATPQEPTTEFLARLNRSTMDYADMELTAAMPQTNVNEGHKDVTASEVIVPKAPSRLNKTVADEAEMEITEAVPRPVTKLSGGVSETKVEATDMELTAAVPSLMIAPSVLQKNHVGEGDPRVIATVPKSSRQLNRTCADEADMELTAAVPQATKPPEHGNKTMLGVTDMEETAGASRPIIMKETGEESQTVENQSDLKVCASVSEPAAPEVDGEMDKSVMGATDKGVAPWMGHPISDLPCQVTGKNADASDAQMTSGALQADSEPSGQRSEGELFAGDSKDRAAAPQTPIKSIDMNKSTRGETEMELTAAVPQLIASGLPGPARETAVDASDEVLAVPQDCVQQSSIQLNKTVMEGADMEMTAAVPQKVQLSRKADETTMGIAEMEETAAASPAVINPRDQVINKTVADAADMEMTTAVTQTLSQKPAGGLHDSIADGRGEKVNVMAQLKTAAPEFPSPMSKTILDGADMTITAAVPQTVPHGLCRLNRSLVSEKDVGIAYPFLSQETIETSTETKINAEDLTDMKITSATPQTIRPRLSTIELNKGVVGGVDANDPGFVVETSKTVADAVDMEVTGTSSQVVSHRSAQLGSSVINPGGIENASIQEYSVGCDVNDEQDNLLTRSGIGLLNVSDQVDVRPVHGSADASSRTVPSASSDSDLPAPPLLVGEQELAPQPSTVTVSEDPQLVMSLETGVTTNVDDETSLPIPGDLGGVLSCRRPAVDSPCRPSPKRGRLLGHSPTPSPPKRLREESDDSLFRSPKSPRLEEVVEGDAKPNEASRVDVSLEEASHVEPVAAERCESGQTGTRLSSGDQDEASVINLRLEDRNSSGSGLGSQQMSDESSPIAHPGKRIATPQLERLPGRHSGDSSGSSQQELPHNPHAGSLSSVCLEQPPLDIRPGVSDPNLKHEILTLSSSPSLERKARLTTPVQRVRAASPSLEINSSMSPQVLQTMRHTDRKQREFLSPPGEVDQASPRQERPLPGLGRLEPHQAVADTSVSEMFAGTPLRLGTRLEIDLLDESFPDIGVLNDSIFGGSQQPAVRPSTGLDISRQGTEPNLSYRKTDRSVRQEAVVARGRGEREPSPPREEVSGWRRNHGVLEQRHSRVLDAAPERKHSRVLDESPRAHSRMRSPERRYPLPLDEASGQPVAACRTRRSEATDSRRDAETARPMLALDGQELPSLPPPLRLPNCKHLVRSLRAHLEAYQRAREASEQAMEEALSRLGPVH